MECGKTSEVLVTLSDESPTCTACGSEKLKKLLATKCGGEHAPTGLKDRLRSQIRYAVLEQAEVTVESGPEGVTTTTVEVRSTRIERR